MWADTAAQAYSADELFTKNHLLSKMTKYIEVLWKLTFLLGKFQETVFHLMTALNPGQIGKSVSPDWANNFEQIIYSVKIAAFPH